MQVRGVWSGKAHRSAPTSLERTDVDMQGFPCRLFLASQLNGRTSSAEWRQRRNNFSPCFSLLESHIFLMESFSWVSEGPSPLKETQTVKKNIFEDDQVTGHHPGALTTLTGSLLHQTGPLALSGSLLSRKMSLTRLTRY